MMGFLKQAILRLGFSYLTKGRFWPKAAIDLRLIGYCRQDHVWASNADPGMTQIHFPKFPKKIIFI